jgi:hypothetical protein
MLVLELDDLALEIQVRGLSHGHHTIAFGARFFPNFSEHVPYASGMR